MNASIPPVSVHLVELERMLATSADEIIVPRERPSSPPPQQEDGMVVATIAFEGEHAHGTLSLIGRPAVMTALQPAPLDEERDVVACEVLGDLANLVLGRLKAHLLMRGVDIAIGTPVTGVARNMRPTDDAFPCCQQVELAAGCVFMRLDASFDERFELGDVRLSNLPALGDHGGFFFDEG